MTPTADDVLWQLQHSAVPVTLRDLASRTYLPRRAAEAAVQELRLAGYPIVSSGDGIRLSSDPDEVRECGKALRRRLVSQALTARALLRTARRMQEQRDLTLWTDAA